MLTVIYFNCIAFTLNSGINKFLIMEAVISSENLQKYCSLSVLLRLICQGNLTMAVVVLWICLL